MELKDKEEMKFDREKIKKRGLKRFIASIKNSLNGLIYAYLNEQSLTLHAFLTIFVLISGFYFNISKVQWAILVVVMAIIIIAELLNTAIEAVVDMVTDKYNELAKVAKDCASAAAFIASILALGLYLYVFVPKFIEIF